jgi:hypothetical protein
MSDAMGDSPDYRLFATAKTVVSRDYRVLEPA